MLEQLGVLVEAVMKLAALGLAVGLTVFSLAIIVGSIRLLRAAVFGAIERDPEA